MTHYPETDQSNRILQNMICALGPAQCRSIYLLSLPITYILNEDVLLYMLSFFTTEFLFDVIYLLNKKFKQMVMQIEDNICKRKYSEIQNVDQQQRIFIISNIRKRKCNIEKNRNFLGPFNDLHEVIIKARNNDRILIIHGGRYMIAQKYVIRQLRPYSEEIDKDLEIIGLTIDTNDIEIMVDNVQVIAGNVTFKNVTLINTRPDESYFAVVTYGHMYADNCTFDFYNDPGETYILNKFVTVEIGAFLTVTACKFRNVSVAIEIDYKAYKVIIKNCIFENIWRYGRGSDSCILISDNESRNMRMKLLRQLNYPDDLLAENLSLKLKCEYNIFRNIDSKYPFVESLYYDISNKNSFIIQHNYVEDEENQHDANRMYEIQLPYSPLSL